MDALEGEALAVVVQYFGLVVEKDILVDVLAHCLLKITTTNLETLSWKEPATIPRQDPKLSRAYLRSFQQAVKFEDLLVVARGGFEIRCKILGGEILGPSAGLIAGESFVFEGLDSYVNTFAGYRRDKLLRYNVPEML